MAYAGQLAGQPVLILKEGTSRRRGRDAQSGNIAAAKIVAEVVRTTLGPRGMDKMLVDSLGDVTITNDGATILDEIDVQHPAAKMMVEVSKTQDKEVGDGTTTAVVIAGELLKNAEDLIEKGIHSIIVVSGYKKAADEAVQALRKISVPVDLEDRATLRKVAITSMHGKAVGIAREHLADIAVGAIKHITKDMKGPVKVDKDDIQIVKKEGMSLLDTRLIEGLIIDKEVVHSDMPKRVEDAKIALLDAALEVEKTEFSAEIRIRDPIQMKAFLDEETQMLKDMVEKVAGTKATVVICQKGIDDMAQHFLAKKRILAVRRAKESDMEKLAKASGARVVTSLEDLKPSDLGTAKLVEERKIGEDKMVFIEGCKDLKSVSILVRGGLERIVDEAERSLNDAICVVADVVRENRVVAGGGAIEEELSKELRGYAAKVGGREQLAIEAFSQALESIPRTLAENAGLDPIDILVSLRAAHEKPAGIWMGVDAISGKVIDMMKNDIIDPQSVKEQAIRSAAEAASMILRIDDVIAASKPPEKGPPKGMPESEMEY